ncbi:efflux RND transporter periplasmic adaptor subunit [Thiobacillus denitrificans]|uniref:efflux RND transporter periplasmic adaptor subunit n=1 Tax=Thiobacillus denitrificans TaxID=36861 RepID=UPI00075D6540|nr:efflux RND transporter periplasmic adaptor subunit [Thiobacillus denitrificans]
MNKAALVLLIAVAVGAGGFWLGTRQASSPPASLDALSQPATSAAGQTYVCPMHPHIAQDHAGDCPICGMDLVVLKDASGAVDSQIHVDTATQQKLGVRLAKAERATLTHDMPIYGTLVADESAVLRITPNVSGLLTRLHVSRVGQRIERGQLLYELSSQEALDLQYEYIDILRRGLPAMNMATERRGQNRVILEKARDYDPAELEQAERGVRQSEEQLRSILQPLERDRARVKLRLQQIGFSDAMLDRLIQTDEALGVVQARAQRDCVVQAVMARPGMTVGTMTEILHCVDPAHAQIEMVLYPDQLNWVEEGNAVTLVFSDGETIKAKLRGLHPLLDETTRTLRVRMPVTLSRTPRLGEYAQVTIHATPREVLSVPKSAVMRSGRGNFVMRALDKGHFMPVKVVTGIETAERIAIRDGLDEGDQVAVNGLFLLDAAASIADSAQRMRASQAPAQ